MKRILVCCLILLSLFIAIPVQASNVSGALWLGILQVSNNSTATTGVSVNFTANSTAYIAGNYLNSSANNTAIQYSGADVPFMPGYNGNPWIAFVPSIGTSGILNDSLYMGGSTSGGQIRLFGTLAVNDSASLEPAANFTQQIDNVYLTDGSILSKSGAVTISKSSTNVTAILENTPSSFVNVHSADSVEGAYVEQSYAAIYVKSVRFRAFNSDAGAPHGMALAEIQVWDNVTAAWVSPTSSTGTWGTPANAYDGNTATVATDTAAASSYSTYITLTLPSTILSNKVRWWATDSSGFMTTKQIDTGAGITPLVAQNVPDGEYSPYLTADGTNVWLVVGTHVSSNTSITSGISDTNTNWQFGGTGTPYMGRIREWVGGNLKGDWQWQYAATFTDASGNGNTGTPTFRTTSSDPDVSAYILQFGPLAESTAPPYNVDDPTPFITGNITTSGNFSTSGTYPGAQVITDVSNSSNTPPSMLQLTLALLGLLALAWLISWFMRNSQAESQLIRGLAIAGMLGLMLAVHAIDSMIFYFYVFFAVGIISVSRVRDVEGTGNTGNNLFGFLITSWLGMTVINRILEGVLLTTAERSIMNTLTIYRPWNVAGIFTLPVPNVSFITTGIPALMRWDYSYLGGGAQMIQYLMYSITGVVAVVFLGFALNSAASIFSRGR